MNSKAAQAVRRGQSAQRAEAGVCTIRFRPIYAMTDEALSNSEREAPDVPVHQPPDHEDYKDQPDYATDTDRSALTVVAAAVEPNPAPKENYEQQDDQN
jgi:hypothetical protein